MLTTVRLGWLGRSYILLVASKKGRIQLVGIPGFLFPSLFSFPTKKICLYALGSGVNLLDFNAHVHWGEGRGKREEGGRKREGGIMLGCWMAQLA